MASNDPYFEDAENAKKAKSLGITTAEFIKRKSNAIVVCNADIKDRLDCFNEIIEKGNQNYAPELSASKADKSLSSSKESLTATLDKLRPNWREITNSKGFNEWKMSLSENEKSILNDSWDPYLLNEKIQQYIDQKNKQNLKNSTIKLSCYVNKNDLVLDVDFDKSIVNGYPAQINDNYIRYSTSGLDLSISRASGSIRVDYVPPYSKKGIPLLPDYGQCKKVENNSF